MIILLLLLLITPCQAQVVYDGDPVQKKTGIYYSGVLIKTDMESGEITQKPIEPQGDVKIVSCVEYDDGDCLPSDYFKATLQPSDEPLG